LWNSWRSLWWRIGRILVNPWKLRARIEEVDRQLGITVADQAEMRDWIDQAVLRIDQRAAHHKGNLDDAILGLVHRIHAAGVDLRKEAERLDRKIELEDAKQEEHLRRLFMDRIQKLSAEIVELRERTNAKL